MQRNETKLVVTEAYGPGTDDISYVQDDWSREHLFVDALFALFPLTPLIKLYQGENLVSSASRENSIFAFG